MEYYHLVLSGNDKVQFFVYECAKTKLPGDQKIVVLLNMYYTKYKNTCDLSQTFNCAGKQSSLRNFCNNHGRTF